MGYPLGDTQGEMRGDKSGQESIADRMPSGLSFYADYTKGDGFGYNWLTPEYATSSVVPVYTAVKSAAAPSSAINKNGVITVNTTTNLPDFTNGIWTSTGFLGGKEYSGYLAEAQATNALKDSYFNNATSTYWRAVVTATVGGDNTYVNPCLGGQVLKVVSTAQFDGVQTAMANKPTLAVTNKCTVYALVRGSGSAMLYFKGDTAGLSQYGTPVTLSDKWVQISANFTNDGSVLCNVGVVSNDALTTIYIAHIQFETAGSTSQPVATSFIPTTTAAATRAADVLTYLTAGNRNANEETILIKFMPLGGSFANDGILRVMVDSSTKIRKIDKNTTGNVLRIFPNGSDSASVQKASTTVPALNTSYVVGGVFKHSSPYANIYVNGLSEGTYTVGDWTTNAWGSTFYIGSNSAGINQLSGIIQRVAIFNRALTANEMAVATAEMNR
jgi:hypothetical protein